MDYVSGLMTYFVPYRQDVWWSLYFVDVCTRAFVHMTTCAFSYKVTIAHTIVSLIEALLLTPPLFFLDTSC